MEKLFFVKVTGHGVFTNKKYSSYVNCNCIKETGIIPMMKNGNVAKITYYAKLFDNNELLTISKKDYERLKNM